MTSMQAIQHGRREVQVDQYRGSRERIHIPPELVIMILEHLQGDKTVLAECSLVCREWVPLAYQHLFRTIAVNKPTRGMSQAVGTLLHGFRGAPHIAVCVQEIALVADPLAGIAQQMLCIEDLQRLLAVLKNAQALRVAHAHFTSSLPMNSVLPNLRRRISTLSLKSMLAPPNSLALAQVIGIFSAVDRICLKSFSDDLYGRAFLHLDPFFLHPCLGTSDRPRVQSLVVKECTPRMTIASVRSLQYLVDCSTLKELALHITDFNAIAALNDAICARNVELRRLEVNLLRLPVFFDIHEAQYDIRVPALSTPSLQSAHFTMMVWGHDTYVASNASVWRYIIGFIRDVADSIQDVHIRIHTAEVRTVAVTPTTKPVALRYLGMLDWSLLDTVASGCRALDKLLISVVNGDSEEYTNGTWLREEMQVMVDSRISHQVGSILQVN